MDNPTLRNHKQKKSNFKEPMKENNNEVGNQFIRRLPAVYLQDDGRSSFLAADKWTDAYLSL